MYIRKASSRLGLLAFRALRTILFFFPGGKMSAFGAGSEKIGTVIVINLDRQSQRWHQILRELGRFRIFNGDRLTSIVTRLSAVDARNGRAVAATADVDPNYRLGNQLHVQPDADLEKCFGPDEPIRMTRQEIAVARSHIEAWKTVASGNHEHVLILEDDVWFTPSAAAIIDQGWVTAFNRQRINGGPDLLYLSYEDAGDTAERSDACDVLFRPVRGLWFLSGYVLSRKGAAALLRAMPVVGPVDMWMNYRFEELETLALSSPAILQRKDGSSDNSYSVLPYLARAGIVDVSAGSIPPKRSKQGALLAWTGNGDSDNMAMALSMLGLRVCIFDTDEKSISFERLEEITDVFDALVNVPLTPNALQAAISKPDVKFVWDELAYVPPSLTTIVLSKQRAAVVGCYGDENISWEIICSLLDLPVPVEPFPVDTPSDQRLFRDDRKRSSFRHSATDRNTSVMLDESPWVLPPNSYWQPQLITGPTIASKGDLVVHATMTELTPSIRSLAETFPGNLASFAQGNLSHDSEGAHLLLERATTVGRPYRSGAFISTGSFAYGCFEAEIKAAAGSGLVTGFFLHRGSPRQEIDIEFAGNNPHRMVVNVYFNPGSEGAEMAFGYRGAPTHIDLGFDATEAFHRYAIDWRPGMITWSVDGRIVHKRVSWDPTPIPHLPMHLHGNLWAPNSKEFSGHLSDEALPARASIRNVSVWT